MTTLTGIPERKDACGERLPGILLGMKIGKGERLLDYGCGTGHVIKRFLLPVAEASDATIVGVDNSAKMIEYCKEHNAHARVEYVLGDAYDADFPLKGQTFDRIFCTWVFQYIHDYARILKELQKLLKPGGQLWVIEGGDPRYFRFLDGVRKDPELAPYIGGDDVLPTSKWVQFEDPDVEKYTRACLAEAGLQVVHFETPLIEDVFASLGHCVDEFTVGVTNSEKLPPKLREKLNDVCRSHMLNWPPNANLPNRFTYTYKLLVFLAQK